MEDKEQSVTPATVLQTLMDKWGAGSVEELAQRIGLPARSLYRWQSGKHAPNFASTIEMLEQADVLRWNAFEFENPDQAARYLAHLAFEWGELIWDVQHRYEQFESNVAGALEELGGDYAEKAASMLTKPWADRTDGGIEGGEPPPQGQLLLRLAGLEAKVAQLPTAEDLRLALQTVQEAIDRVATPDRTAAQPDRSSTTQEVAP